MCYFIKFFFKRCYYVKTLSLVCYLKKKKKTLKLTRFRILGDSIHFDIASWNLVLPSNFAFSTRERGTSCGVEVIFLQKSYSYSYILMLMRKDFLFTKSTLIRYRCSLFPFLVYNFEIYSIENHLPFRQRISSARLME